MAYNPFSIPYTKIPSHPRSLDPLVYLLTFIVGDPHELMGNQQTLVESDEGNRTKTKGEEKRRVN